MDEARKLGSLVESRRKMLQDWADIIDSWKE
ncbi:hypothetical protein F931_01535 [Acinetobacter pittii ANC 4050]|uniref:Uncharacterized protein n=1 Tax=Acinetobacter pittii ANC 4050 TaxID=1217691 RepID=R8YMW5_ACIPI|nr:hypothetical protein F931_01535 [Acinetobacter pittii ANC 4050]